MHIPGLGCEIGWEGYSIDACCLEVSCAIQIIPFPNEVKIWASLCLCFLIPISHRSKCISFTNSLNVPAQWQEELFWSRTLCAALCIGKIFCIQRTLWGTPNELKFEGFRHPYILPPCNYLKKYKYFFFQHFFLDTRKKNILPGWGKKKKLSSPLKIKGLNLEFKFPGLEFKYIGLFKKILLVERPTLPASPSSFYYLMRITERPFILTCESS